jgi:hypothetical protein
MFAIKPMQLFCKRPQSRVQETTYATLGAGTDAPAVAIADVNTSRAIALGTSIHFWQSYDCDVDPDKRDLDEPHIIVGRELQFDTRASFPTLCTPLGTFLTAKHSANALPASAASEQELA